MRTTLRPCVCRRALSPLLGGPFLMSPRRRQSATAGPAPAGPRHQVGRTGWAAGHGYLRGSYEARSPPGPLCRAPGRFTRDWVFVYFYSQSIHTTLSSVARRRLSTRAGLQTVSRPDIAIDLHTAPGEPGPVCTVSHSYPRGLMLRHRWRLAAY